MRFRFVNLHSSSGIGEKSATGIQIPLHRGTIADVHPGLIDVDAPVDPHDVASRRVQLAKEAGRAGAEVNHRHAGGADALDQGAGIRSDETYVIVRDKAPTQLSNT